LPNLLDAVCWGGEFKDDLSKIEKAVEDTFKRLRISFEHGDEKDARAILKEYNWVNSLCDQRVNDYLNEKDKSIESGESVALALYFRYLKRINSHLRNVATSVVNPFHRIGFRVKKKK